MTKFVRLYKKSGQILSFPNVHFGKLVAPENPKIICSFKVEMFKRYFKMPFLIFNDRGTLENSTTVSLIEITY